MGWLEDSQAKYPFPRFHLILITEVTRMSGAMRCVAGLSLNEWPRIVRPLQSDGNNWPIADDWSTFHPGHVLAARPARRNPGPLPHSRNDLPILGTPEVVGILDEPSLHAAILKTCDDSIFQAFQKPLSRSHFVPENTDCPSLGAIKIQRANATFSLDQRGKLRCSLREGRFDQCSLSVTCSRLSLHFEPHNPHHLGHDLDDANAWLETTAPADEIIVRLGLARPWDGPYKNWNPKRCYLQVNGIIHANDPWLIFDDV